MYIICAFYPCFVILGKYFVMEQEGIGSTNASDKALAEVEAVNTETKTH